MSLKSYLFTLIGSLILLLTASQMMLVYWIDQNLTQEVDTKARLLSNQVIELAFEQIDTEEGTTINVPHKVIRTAKISNKIGNKHNNFEIITIPSDENHPEQNKELSKKINKERHIERIKELHKDNSNKSQINEEVNSETEFETANLTKDVLKHEIKTLINTIHQDQIDILSTNSEIKVVVDTPNMVSKHWISKMEKTSSTSNLIHSIQLVLFVSAIIALLLAYWISTRFNQPLKELASGFKRLSNGDYRHPVPEQGVNEIRTTITHYNKMVTRLDELTKAEKQHKEITHLAELGEVSRGLAHALRNPIHTIGLTLEQLSLPELNDEQKQALLNTAQNKITHIDKNIKALLTLTTSGISRNEHVPVLSVIQDIILEYKSCIAMTNSKTLRFDISVPTTLTLLGAESEIRSIVHTLIINACDASNENDTVCIQSTQLTDNVFELSIEDTGNGVSDTVKDKLFQPHISTKPEGAGMGLYIANRIISLHYNGKISLTNKADNSGCIALAHFSNHQPN